MCINEVTFIVIFFCPVLLGYIEFTHTFRFAGSGDFVRLVPIHLIEWDFSFFLAFSRVCLALERKSVDSNVKIWNFQTCLLSGHAHTHAHTLRRPRKSNGKHQKINSFFVRLSLRKTHLEDKCVCVDCIVERMAPKKTKKIHVETDGNEEIVESRGNDGGRRTEWNDAH